MPARKLQKEKGDRKRKKSAQGLPAGLRSDASRPEPSESKRTGAKRRRSLVSDPSAGPKASVSHVEIATKYAQDIVSGAIPACKWVKLACERQLKDLERQSDPNYPWRFDEPSAERVCWFVELTPHIKGPLRGELIRLQPWQVFILTTVFGWLSKTSNKRRFREAYTEVPRGNGKSALSSPVGLYMLAADGEGGAEVYSAATTREQARIVFGIAQAMARGMEEFRGRFGVTTAAHSINQEHSASWFRPLSSDANSLDGLNIHCAIIDEVHAHRSRELYDVLKTACSKRNQPLLWEITTAGSDRAGVCYEIRTYVVRILSGVCEDERIFGIIYTIDDEDDWADIEAAKKANPNWGVSVFPDAIAAELKQALQMASKQPSYKTKYLDVWVNADHAWMDMQKWAQCADSALAEEDFAGQPCTVGLDLASKLDILAKIKLFRKNIDGKVHWTFFGDYWTPELRIELSQNSQYKGWAIEGKLHTCPGETNDYDTVEDAIRADCQTYQVLEVAHDPYQAVQMMNNLQAENIVTVEIPQMPKYLSEPMKELEAAVYDKRFHFNGDPILTWAVSNVVCHLDKNDNMFPTKERYENKIDPVTALLTALSRAMLEEPVSEYPLTSL